jgi:hypothetical protein
MRWPRKPPPALDLAFGRARRRHGLLPWMLLGVSALIAADMGRVYVEQHTALESLAGRIQTTPGPVARATPAVYAPRDLDRELALARETLQRMALPWNGLFQALGACETEGVALLTLAPDAGGSAVQITAEARDVPSMLNYLSRMEERPEFAQAVLLRQDRKTTGESAIVFVASATWTRR